MLKLRRIVLLAAATFALCANAQEEKPVVSAGDPSVSLKIHTRLDGSVNTYPVVDLNKCTRCGECIGICICGFGECVCGGRICNGG